MHLTREQWKAAVDWMIDQRDEVPKGKMTELLDYFVHSMGPAAAPDKEKNERA
jgi:hypothetical protein